MSKGKREQALDYRKKNRRKAIRTVVQFAILLALTVVLIRALVDIEQYQEPDKTQWANKDGFVALTYFGVSRNGTPDLIAKKKLDEQLQALHDQGYVTISQQDVLDFYNQGKALPEKALFLAFEDGRNDSSLYAQPYLEKYNYKATILSYANKAGTSDPKFLQPGDMKKMVKKGFWELGSNGYRLSYINIFDHEGRLLGMKDEQEFKDKSIAKSYNHYLMDFIRDENNIPAEHREDMEKRIAKDYDLMKEIYTRTLGEVPQVYMIMHANSLYHGMNRLVAEENDKHIRELFSMHFNREGSGYNKADETLFDLTRVQAAPYWQTNHLLMKLQHDTGRQMSFVTGDKDRASHWGLEAGAAEYADNRIILTSPVALRGLLTLMDGDTIMAGRDVELSAKLNGNVVGRQTVYARYNPEKSSYIKVSFENNELLVEQKAPGKAPERIFKHEFDDVAKVNDQYPVKVQQTRKLEMQLQKNTITVKVDGEVLVDAKPLHEEIASGKVALAAAASELNKHDLIYDAIFDDVQVTVRDAEGRELAKLDNRLTGLDWAASQMKKAVDSAIGWAIETF